MILQCASKLVLMASANRSHAFIAREEGVKCPLLHLDPVAQATLVALLPGRPRRMLRLASKATQRLVDKWTKELSVSSAHLQQRHGELQARFPALAQLTVLGSDEEQTQLPRMQPWSTVTSLLFEQNWPDLPSSIPHLIPNVQELRLDSSCTGWLLRNAGSLAALCQQLPHLTSLQLSSDSWNRPFLSDKELLALAALPKLTALSGCANITTAPGWAALTSMRALRTLWLNINSEAPLLDMRSMTTLSQLALAYEPYSVPSSTLQAHLPATLATLCLNHLIDGTLPALPQLTNLTLMRGTARRPLLLLLAVQCPRLAYLEVEYLALSEHCYSTPLTAVTELAALGGAIDDAGGVEYRHVFPALRSLSLCGTHGKARWWSRWEGCTALTRLDVGSRRSGHTMQLGWVLRTLECRALAMLPAFASLRLDVTADHVRRVGQLTQLRTLELVWAVGGDLDDECRAFGHSDVLAQLQSVSLSAYGSRVSESEALHAVAWLANASRLIEICWALGRCSAAPAEILRTAAAAHPSMRRFRADGDGQRWLAMTPHPDSCELAVA